MKAIAASAVLAMVLTLTPPQPVTPSPTEQPAAQATAQPDFFLPGPRSAIKLPIVSRSVPTRCATTQPAILPAWLVYEGKYTGVNGVAEQCNPLNRAIYLDYSFDALDSRGNIIESISASSFNPVPAGGIMCARAGFSTKPANAAQFRFRVRGWSYASSFLHNGGTLMSSSYTSATHTVNATIRNMSNNDVWVDAAVALYDAGGRILQCDELPSINDWSLTPSQTTSLRSEFFDYDPVVVDLLKRATQAVVTLSKTP